MNLLNLALTVLEWLGIILGVLFGVVGPCILYIYLLVANARLFLWPSGRIKRLTFWEGLTAWFLINTFPLIVIIMSMMYSMSALTLYLGDTDFSIYPNVHLSLLFLEWLFAIWTLAAICAKRWHDLNFTGWMAAFNTIPVVVTGWVVFGFFNAIERQMVYRFTTDSNARGLWQNRGNLIAEGKASFDKNFIQNSPMLVTFTVLVVAGAFIFPCILKGTSGGNAHGKTVA